ncbi:hypothetical protein AN958_09964 [Leucoagaricus sp. SymC.cos]|nr:hypothetical protein AN958_09964 [Leucoagaricus sp. SymC.cos]
MIQSNAHMPPASDNFLEIFVKWTIQGAEFDSSQRYPPPRCHPGTRKSITDSIQFWLHDPWRTNRMLWLVGPAGVGKSAIMQTIAEEVSGKRILASLFFLAARDRKDPSKSGPDHPKGPSKVIPTLAYRIAVQCPRYAAFLRARVAADPKIMEKSIVAQFHAFIVIPFTKTKLYTRQDPLILVLDGLDEWEDVSDQRLLLGLISHFSTSHPNAPLLWVVASRPEAHITSYLTRRRLASAYYKVEVFVDSTEACQDVEHFLRSEFETIKGSHPVIMALYPQWPQEKDFLKLAAAASGLFVYAATAVRFISDMAHGDPISQFQLLLDLIGGTSSFSASSQIQPMAHLDSLYRHILCQISPQNLTHAKLILSHLMLGFYSAEMNFLCNWIGILPHVAYGAFHNLHSVIQIPLPSASSDDLILKFYHKSFHDFLGDRRRSEDFLGILPVLQAELHALRILSTIPHNRLGGMLLRYSPPYNHIPLFWPTGGSLVETTNNKKFLYAEASLAILRISSLEHPIIPSLAHALGVMDFRSVMIIAGIPYEIFQLAFDMDSDLAKQLQENGILCEIPASLLDTDTIRLDKDELCIIAQEKGMPWASYLYPRGGYCDKFLSWKDRIISILTTPGIVVRALIGIHRGGWVEVKYPIPSQRNSELETEVAYFYYEFGDNDGDSDSLEEDDQKSF